MTHGDVEVVELRAIDAETAFGRLARLPRCLFLDSAMRHPTLGRYSFLAADPFEWLVAPGDGRDALRRLADRLRQFACKTLAGLPPFQGGAAGLLGYELRHSLERLPEARFNEWQVPAMAVGLYDVVIAFDHLEGKAWLISQGWPEQEPARRRRRARQRAARFLAVLDDGAPAPPYGEGAVRPSSRRLELQTPRFPRPSFQARCDTSSRQDCRDVGQSLQSNFSPDGYLAAVQRAIDYIAAGDVFQVNLSQQLVLPASADSLTLYRRLRRCNAAPFAGYFDLGETQILSASPERFLHVAGRAVETRPIKGTRRRSGDAPSDAQVARELMSSEKDRAENVMIVDLLRNDLSRVCRPESIRVSQLCQIEPYEHVMHLVSAVRGELREGQTAVDLVRACFPGGSVTGAPKIRAMEIIAELEPSARGAYCGALGYLGFDGAMDLNILIRTITAAGGWWQFAVGGGIVVQSEPQREYEETWEKAEGMLQAIEPERAWR